MSAGPNSNLGAIATAPDDVGGYSWRKNLGRTSAHLGSPRLDQWWTGMAPSFSPGFVKGKLFSLSCPNLANCSRQSVLDYFNNTWTLNELLFSSLIGDEAFYRPPYHGLRHPLVFYYVHPSVLYVNKLRLACLVSSAVNPYFESLFEIGVDEMSWDDMSKNDIEWPTVDEALQYRRQVYALIKSLIESHPDLKDGHPPILQDHPLWTLFMGFEHERIHIETSSVLIRELPVHLVSRPQEWPDLAPLEMAGKVADSTQSSDSRPVAGRDYPENSFVPVAAQEVTIGKPSSWPTYGWDNEYGQRSVTLSDFAANRFLVSNGEFWQFVIDGGYQSQENWTETGWQWRKYRDIKWPTFWLPAGPASGHQYQLRTCFEVVPMQWSWPAVVNYHEAKAFSKWKSDKEGQSYRLITEAEHQALRKASNFCNADENELLPSHPFNTNLRQGSESAVNAARHAIRNGASHGTGNGAGATDSSSTNVAGDSSQFYDLFGNVWQWCEDHFNPLDGFKVHRYYDDFSTPCFDGEHQMIVGGSFISTGDEASAWARFHFRPHFFQHAGFRLVQTLGGCDGAVVHVGAALDKAR